jgi:hypothetical protein
VLEASRGESAARKYVACFRIAMGSGSGRRDMGGHILNVAFSECVSFRDREIQKRDSDAKCRKVETLKKVLLRTTESHLQIQDHPHLPAFLRLIGITSNPQPASASERQAARLLFIH